MIQRTGGNVQQSPGLYGTLFPEPSHRFSTWYIARLWIRKPVSSFGNVSYGFRGTFSPSAMLENRILVGAPGAIIDTTIFSKI